MEIRKDILGRTPEIGDVIVFNPPWYKELVHGVCHGFTTTGLPKVVDLPNTSGMSWRVEQDGFYTPKTGFVVVK